MHHLPGIKGDNILQEIEDKSILEGFTKAEMEYPSPRNFVRGAPVYASRRFKRPKTFGRAILNDFGSAVYGDQQRNHDAQPNVYRSPEVMLKANWSYSVDIWNVGVMVCSDLIFGPLIENFLTARVRSGICSSPSICSTGKIPMAKVVRPGHILPRYLGCWDHHRWICLNEGNGIGSFSQKEVDYLQVHCY